jgi:hypothetical protein
LQKQCKYINQHTGEPCGAFALDSGYCFSHDPARRDDKQRAVVKGGEAPKKVALHLVPMTIKTPDDVLLVLEEIVNKIRVGELIVSNPANTIGFLCSHILKAIELSSVDKKLETIDRVILERRSTGRK